MNHTRFGSWEWPSEEEEDKPGSLSKQKKMGLFFLSCIILFTVTLFLGQISVFNWRTNAEVSPDRLRVLCRTISITGEQGFLPGGKISYGLASTSIHMWVSTVNRTIECREMANLENIQHFELLKHFINLTESNLTSLVEIEISQFPLSQNETLFYYYGLRSRWRLDTGPGRIHHPELQWNDKIGLFNEPGDVCETGCQILVYIGFLLARLSIALLPVLFIALVVLIPVAHK